MSPLITTDKSVLAISWEIATNPKLYREFARNPYSPKSENIGKESFPASSKTDIILAVILAEPEGRYDRNFKILSRNEQDIEFQKQILVTTEINKCLNDYFTNHQDELKKLSDEFLYDVLFNVAFKRSSLEQTELAYSQNQRKCLKLLIFNYIKFSSKQAISKLDQSRKSAHNKKISLKLFGLFSILSFFYLVFIFLDIQIIRGYSRLATTTPQENKALLADDLSVLNRGMPKRITIPSINVDAAVENMGVTPDGAMDVPGNIVDVGWYKLGPKPGENGSAVISGHFDGKKGESGVFNNLDKLKKGDKIFVKNDLGANIIFTVRESQILKPGYADNVFQSSDNGIHLNLVTCDGIWDIAKKSYTKRLVVFADTP